MSDIPSLQRLYLSHNQIHRYRFDVYPSLSLSILSSLPPHPSISHSLSLSLLLVFSLSPFLFSVDDIACLATCPAIIDVSIDGNPLSDSPGHRAAMLSHFSQLAVLNQTPVSVSAIHYNMYIIYYIDVVHKCMKF